MRIIPIRGLNLRCRGHVDGGVPVECEDREALELLSLGMVERAPVLPDVHEAKQAPEPVIETASAPAAPEAAVVRPNRRARK